MALGAKDKTAKIGTFILRYALLGVFLWTFTLPAYAKHINGIKGVNNVEIIVNDLMNALEKDDMRSFFTIMDKYWKIPSKNIQDLMKDTIKQRKNLNF